jgi:hypothetical protein
MNTMSEEQNVTEDQKFEHELDKYSPENIDKPKKERRTRGDKRAEEFIEARRRRLYRHQLDGHSTRQLVYDHAAREGIGVATAWRDWHQVSIWNEEDWKKDRENMLARIQTMRIRLVNAAMKKGQLQTAAQVLDSLGRVLGESTPEQVSVQVPLLNINVEPKKEPAQLPQAEVIDAIETRLQPENHQREHQEAD